MSGRELQPRKVELTCVHSKNRDNYHEYVLHT